jgi:hypothetical protein
MDRRWLAMAVTAHRPAIRVPAAHHRIASVPRLADHLAPERRVGASSPSLLVVDYLLELLSAAARAATSLWTAAAVAVPSPTGSHEPSREGEVMPTYVLSPARPNLRGLSSEQGARPPTACEIPRSGAIQPGTTRAS